MGKSPGKWIKTLLFGKKSSRLSLQKRRASNVGNSKDGNLGKDPTLAIDSSLNSEQIPNISGVNGISPKPQKGSSSDLHSGRETQTESNEKSSTAAGAPVQPQSSIEERAAIKAQSAFRGYLARRAFYALKGIIRLQALVRGHLTRRQALATLRCTWGIVKFQSLFRGSRTRENIDFEVIKSSYRPKACQASNALARKLVSSSISSKPLGFQYSREEPNLVSRWLDRWTFSVFWKPPPQPKKLPDSKPQGRRYAMETESGRSKRTVRKNLGSNSPADSALTNPPPELDKSKRNLRKISSYPLEISPENPQSELEMVKRSLRKVSEIESEKTVKKDSSPALANESVNAPESNPLTTPVKIETVASANGDASTEEEASEENSKTSSKRRTSFSGVKPEYSENVLQHQHTPKLPSYMAATESAKARLRGQNSPRIGSEESDKTSFTRRHSLPSSINGKVNSVSPRIQRPVLAGGKGALRNERSVVSSRDGNDKPLQVEWKR